ncbi:MAG TPA: adenylosuccinate synthetase [Candidatus Obscuribacter sp.]|nr:adenylosuccinate synthetase [Candidatus Obscuribacter sp.]
MSNISEQVLSSAEPQAHIVLGLGYGDEGKGSFVDHLVRKSGARFIVRFNGGAQAAHHVVTEDGREHCFRQFGSGMFVAGTSTILSRYVLIDPQYLLEEAEELAGKGVCYPLERMIVSADAPIITPFNRLLNQMMEVARSGNRHGSCGFGVGLTQRDVEELGSKALYVRDLATVELGSKLFQLWQKSLREAEQVACQVNSALYETLKNVDIDYYEQLFRHFYHRVRVLEDEALLALIRENGAIFEGAQGLMLDQNYGTFPHCTRSNCTFENALDLLKDSGFAGEIRRIGLLRGYATRHGAGPLVTVCPDLDLSSCHNGSNPWQGQFRLGWFDAVAARYALAVVGGVDLLVLTNLDRMATLKEVKIATAYKCADPRFFSESGEMLLPDKGRLDYLAARTEALSGIVPSYMQMPFQLESYLKALEQLLKHPIGAISLSPMHDKSYR